MPPFTLDGEPVSSSAIRAAIEAGDLALAGRLLGRPYAVTGRGSRLRRDPVLAFEMPVTLPPAGWYRVRVHDRDEAAGDEAGHVHIDEEGQVQLQGIWLGGPRWSVTFASDGAT